MPIVLTGRSAFDHHAKPARASITLNHYQKPVLHENLEDPVTLAGFSVSSSSVPVAAVAVGMWKPAFCAGFQAPRAGRKRCGQSPSIPPSERHFHSKPSILKHFGETVPFGKQFFAKCVPFRKPRKTSTSPDSRSEPFFLCGAVPRVLVRGCVLS
jgi:hypothetical protein